MPFSLTFKASLNEASEGFLCRPMGAGSFSNATGCRASFSLFMPCVDAMQRMGLIEVLIGFRRRIEFDGFEFTSKGQLTRIRAKQALLDLATSHGVEPAALGSHYLIAPTIHDLVRVKADSMGDKEGASLFPKDSPEMQLIYAEMKELNDRLRLHCYSLSAVPELHRVFNQRDAKGFDFDRGGRLSTSDGTKGFQQLPSVQRLNILIDDSPVVEIDLKSCHPTILYALSKQPLPQHDPYNVEGIPRERW